MTTSLGILLILSAAVGPSRAIEARLTPIAPAIDGVLEPLWQQGDSATEFVQMTPEEGEPSTEKTTVYVLYTRDALYVAFRCLSSIPVQAWVEPWDEGSGDGVGVYLDTFGDRRTGYGFWVNARGVQGDQILSNDGRTQDDSWDGVWSAAARIYGWGYAVEIRIPFRTLRYRKGLEAWGVNFARYIFGRAEMSYWSPMRRAEGLRISRFGRLRGIQPGVWGKHLELYPVSFLRYDRLPTLHQTRPGAGLDFTWAPSSQDVLNLTVNPDFGEVEADPYQVNLSRYRLYYPERRPFFIEGQELFRVFQPTGFLSGPLIRLLYTRNIGKRLPTGKEIPILAGLKAVRRSAPWEGGLFLAATPEVEDELFREPQAIYGVLRLKRSVRGNSTIGLFAGTKEAFPPSAGHTRVLAGDFTYRSPRLVVQSVLSGAQVNGDRDGLLSLHFFYNGDPWIAGGNFTYIGSRYDINELGFVGLPGYRALSLMAGAQLYPRKGPIRQMFAFGGSDRSREFDEPTDTYGAFLGFSLLFRNLWGISVNGRLGKGYEQGTSYSSRFFHANLWSDWTRNLQGGAYFSGGYGYNYRRGGFGWHLWWGGFLRYKVSPSLQLTLSSDNLRELDEKGHLLGRTWILRPRLTYSLTRRLHLSLYSEAVTEGTAALSPDRIRLGGLISWQLAPKSWLYLAVNDLEERQSTTYTPAERIALLKLRYLFYF